MENNTQKDSEIIVRKDYNFNGVLFYQEELTLKETNDVVALFNDSDKDSFKMAGFDLGKYLLEKNLLLRFFSIALKKDNSTIRDTAHGYITQDDLDKLKPSQLLEVINDFFTLNAVLSTVLVAIKNTLDSMKTTQT